MITKISAYSTYSKPTFTSKIAVKKPALNVSAILIGQTSEKVRSLKNVCKEILESLQKDKTLLPKIIKTYNSIRLFENKIFLLDVRND